MSSDENFPQLLARVRDGDEDAAAVIVLRFVDRLVAHAHRHLAPSIRRRVDAEDIVQSVYRTFFRRVRKGEFRLEHWGSLWGLLTRISLRKCARAGRRNNPRETSLTVACDAPMSDFGLSWEALAREPSPAEVAMLNDIIDTILGPLRESHREIVKLTLEGYAQREVAKRVSCSERTVQRVIARAQVNLEKLDAT